jgi:hypothetical protein
MTSGRQAGEITPRVENPEDQTRRNVINAPARADIYKVLDA